VPTDIVLANWYPDESTIPDPVIPDTDMEPLTGDEMEASTDNDGGEGGDDDEKRRGGKKKKEGRGRKAKAKGKAKAKATSKAKVKAHGKGKAIAKRRPKVGLEVDLEKVLADHEQEVKGLLRQAAAGPAAVTPEAGDSSPKADSNLGDDSTGKDSSSSSSSSGDSDSSSSSSSSSD
jgi:hypothetical protein